MYNNILFSMDTFDDLMDRVDELFMMDGPISPTYQDQIDENPYSRWFAYDVTRNHLRYYRDYRNYDIEFMNNKRGPRWALYPDIMVMIDGLVNDGRIVDVGFNYHQNPVYLRSDRVGLVGGVVPMDHDVRLEYLDIWMGRGESVLDLPHLRLTHLHMLFGDGSESRVLIHGPSIKYLSSNTDPTLMDGEFNVYLTSDVDLDYLQVYHGIAGDVNVATSTYRVDRGDSGFSRLEFLINPYMKYLDIATLGRPYRSIREMKRQLFGLGQPRITPLNHFGFEVIPSDDDYYDRYRSLAVNMFVELRDHLHIFPKLTSLSVPVLNSNMPEINVLSDQLVHLELYFVRYVRSVMSMPYRLNYIRTLHLSFPTERENNINIRMGRWNLPDTCDVLSLYTKYSIDKFNVNFDLSRFKNLGYLMVKYHEDAIDWVGPALNQGSIVSIVDYPASPEEMTKKRGYIVVWMYSASIMGLTTAELVELSNDEVVRDTYNSRSFVGRLIRDRGQ